MKVCIHCQKEKPFEEMVKDKRKLNGVGSSCTTCTNEQKKRLPNYEATKARLRSNYATDPDNRKRKKAATKAYRIEHKASVMLEQAKTRAKRFGKDFNLELSDIVIPEFCPILGIKLEHGNVAKKQNSPSLDRVDNSKGYVKDNVRVISYLANHMKADASKEQLLTFAANINSYLMDDDIVRPAVE